TDYALQLLPDDYSIIAAVESFDIHALDAYIRGIYMEELSIRDAEKQLAGLDVQSELAKRLASPVLQVSLSEVEAEQSFAYDSRIQSVFGFALFFCFYTVAFSVNALLHEKQSGLWDRVILSPASKTSMYVGHMLFSYASGLVQVIIVFALFRYVFQS